MDFLHFCNGDKKTYYVINTETKRIYQITSKNTPTSTFEQVGDELRYTYNYLFYNVKDVIIYYILPLQKGGNSHEKRL